LREWDGEEVVISFDRPAGAWMIIAVHSTRLGPGIGGTRMKSYPDLKTGFQDGLRLAAGMTYKWAAAGIDSGGAKGVIAVPPELDPNTRKELLRRYGAFIKRLKGLFLTGPDLGTSSEDMDIIAQTGAPYILGRTPAAGGAGDPGPFTALGVFCSIQAALERIYQTPALAGRRVLVQGVGSVGGALVKHLQTAGAEVLISDANAAALKAWEGAAGLQSIRPDEVYDVSCDIFAPCAVGAVLNEQNIPRLHCKAVVGAANNQLATPGDAGRLRERGILYAPDFIANSGGAIAVLSMETKGWSKKEAEEHLVQAIGRNLAGVFEIAGAEGCTTDEAARRLAQRRLAAHPDPP
jgi:leucine dehydrogenase